MAMADINSRFALVIEEEILPLAYFLESVVLSPSLYMLMQLLSSTLVSKLVLATVDVVVKLNIIVVTVVDVIATVITIVFTINIISIVVIVVVAEGIVKLVRFVKFQFDVIIASVVVVNAMLRMSVIILPLFTSI